MTQRNTIIFVCEHGAAKSIVAAAYFNQLANKAGLNLQAIARGTNPDDELSAEAVTGLANDGLAPGESRPQKLSQQDVRSAQRIIRFCDLPPEYGEPITVEHWNDIPPVSQDYDRARDAILHHVQDLLNRLI